MTGASYLCTPPLDVHILAFIHTGPLLCPLLPIRPTGGISLQERGPGCTRGRMCVHTGVRACVRTCLWCWTGRGAHPSASALLSVHHSGECQVRALGTCSLRFNYRICPCLAASLCHCLPQIACMYIYACVNMHHNISFTWGLVFMEFQRN